MLKDLESDKGVRTVGIRQKKWTVVVIIAAAIVVGGVSYLILTSRGQVFAPAFSVGDTWTWSGTILGGDSENATAFTRTESIIEKKPRLGRECWVFRSVLTDNVGGNAGKYSLNYRYIAVDRWYDAGSEDFLENSKVGEMTPAGPILSIEFPLEIRKRWIDIRAASGYDNSRGIESMDLQMTTRAEVLSKETVTVPAGAFQAYKIEFTTLLSGTGQVTVGGQELTAQVSTTVTETRWYSDSVKNFVKATSDTTTMVTVIGQTATTKTHAERELTSYSLE